MQADEKDRLVERKEVPLFDQEAFREAIINAFVHNAWVDGNAPMITVYSDRIEILSRGGLAPKQTLNGFYLGEYKVGDKTKKLNPTRQRIMEEIGNNPILPSRSLWILLESEKPQFRTISHF